MGSGLEGPFSIAESVSGPGSIAGGETSTVIIDLAERSYAMLCLIPDEDSIPHAARGMVLPVAVTAPAGAATAPVPEGTIELQTFHFQGLQDQVAAGLHIWDVPNIGQQLHELVFFKQAPSVTFEQVGAMFMAPPEASPAVGMDDMAGLEASPATAMRPPFVSFSGVAPISPGFSNWQVADLPAGRLLRDLLRSGPREWRTALRARHDPALHRLATNRIRGSPVISAGYLFCQMRLNHASAPDSFQSSS